MSTFKPIQFNEFLQALKMMHVQLDGHESFLYDIYSYTIEGIDNLVEENIFEGLRGINHLEIIGYCIGEYSYFVADNPKEQIEAYQKDENIIMSISSIVADKYLSLSQFSYSEGALVNRFSPSISTLYVYVNFMLNTVKNYNKKDPTTSLVADLFMKSISICKCTLDLLVRGFETEAFSTWRTLHECECALIIIYKGDRELLNTYLKHMNYGLAFRDSISNKEKQNEIFLSMKEEMKKYDLKSKDIKKFIEYGWLYQVPGVKDDPNFKLNFRDGLERVAGLSMYSKRYEMSSEIIHGSPLLVYSNREYFYYITLLSTYESFFRLEQIFTNIVSRLVNKEQFESYINMRKVYYSHLVSIHKKESANFKRLQEKR